MIHIVGLGGVGFWLAVGLSKVVPSDNMKCWDADTLEGGTGHDRLPWGPPTATKTDLLAGYLSMVHNATSLPALQNRRFTGLLQVEAGDVVIDCSDMPLAERRRIWSTVRNKGAKPIRVSYDGRGSRVIISTGLPLTGAPAGGYANVPSMALSLAAGGLGAEAVRRYLAEPKESFTMSVSVEEGLC
jgi:hypothetical protein